MPTLAQLHRTTAHRRWTATRCGDAAVVLARHADRDGDVALARDLLVAAGPDSAAGQVLRRSRRPQIRAAWVAAHPDGPGRHTTVHGRAERVAVHQALAATADLPDPVRNRLDTTDVGVADHLIGRHDLPIGQGRDAATTIGAALVAGDPVSATSMACIAATPHLRDAAVVGATDATDDPAAALRAVVTLLTAANGQATLSVDAASRVARHVTRRLRAMTCTPDTAVDAGEPAVTVANLLLTDTSTPVGAAATVGRALARLYDAGPAAEQLPDATRVALIGLHSVVTSRFRTQTRLGLDRTVPLTHPTVSLSTLAGQLDHDGTLTLADAADIAVRHNESLLLSAVMAHRDLDGDVLAQVPPSLISPAMTAAALAGDCDDVVVLGRLVATSWSYLHPSLTTHRHGREILAAATRVGDTTEPSSWSTPMRALPLVAGSPLLDVALLRQLPARILNDLLDRCRGALLSDLVDDAGCDVATVSALVERQLPATVDQLLAVAATTGAA